MQILGFKMHLQEGQKEEYKKRHDDIWPELVSLLQEAGISDYRIFLDEDTNTLFATYLLPDGKDTEALPHQEVMKRWWAYMQDIMETNPDHSPVSIPLQPMFYLP